MMSAGRTDLTVTRGTLTPAARRARGHSAKESAVLSRRQRIGPSSNAVIRLRACSTIRSLATSARLPLELASSKLQAAEPVAHGVSSVPSKAMAADSSTRSIFSLRPRMISLKRRRSRASTVIALTAGVGQAPARPTGGTGLEVGSRAASSRASARVAGSG